MRPIYLCGPINGRSDDDCRTWREQVKAIVGAENCLDPMRRDYRGREVECFKEIVEGDKRDIDGSGCVLAYFDRPSVGASMEILYAWESDIPVVVIAMPEQVFSPWIMYHATEITFSIEAGASAAQDAVLHDFDFEGE